MSDLDKAVERVELLPCPLPWCSARPEAKPYPITIEGWWAIQCMACGTRTKLFKMAKEASQSWNTRPTTSDLQQEVDRLKEALANEREECAKVVDRELELRGAHYDAAIACGEKKDARDLQTMVIAHSQSAAAIRARSRMSS